ncbi:polysaccharide deacetylase family protein [Natranaerofaba carboxydovora]|uniref:polysaccharide deacetylase family protein n=1 Tax=Natranaerofaba carboxydovora TaxID=2742683 RepID=UPI001F12E0A7|nr:polysaccharide deacetylase family protein [Natranaerofaba carboxydovora]
MKKRLLAISLMLILSASLLNFTACNTNEETTNNEKQNVDRNGESKSNNDRNNGRNNESGEVLDNGGMILTFDDGYKTDYEVVYPILEEKGIQAVTYISPIFAEKKLGEYMNWEQIKALDEAGWDVEDHTYSHPNMTELTEQDIHQEMEKVNETFEKKGLDIPEHHALPHGAYNDTVKDLLFSYRTTVRKAENTLNPFPLEDKFLDAVDMGIHSTDGLKRLIDKAIEKRKIVIFFTHDVQDDPFDYGITTDKFKSVVEYAVDQDIEILTLTELMEKQEISQKDAS